MDSLVKMLAEMFNQKKYFVLSTILQGFGSFKGTCEHKKKKIKTRSIYSQKDPKVLQIYLC